jgi:hypothetical protein
MNDVNDIRVEQFMQWCERLGPEGPRLLDRQSMLASLEGQTCIQRPIRRGF